MTYRQLFISLCLAGLLALVGMWWMSLRYYSEVTISSPGGRSSVECVVFSGVFGFGVNPYDGKSGSRFHSLVKPAKNLVLFDGEQHDPMGDLDWGKDLITGIGAGPGHYRYHAISPLWQIYLAFVGVAYGPLRLVAGKRWRQGRFSEPSGGGDPPPPQDPKF